MDLLIKTRFQDCIFSEIIITVKLHLPERMRVRPPPPKIWRIRIYRQHEQLKIVVECSGFAKNLWFATLRIIPDSISLESCWLVPAPAESFLFLGWPLMAQFKERRSQQEFEGTRVWQKRRFLFSIYTFRIIRTAHAAHARWTLYLAQTASAAENPWTEHGYSLHWD